jgi:hypothetical protein
MSESSLQNAVFFLGYSPQSRSDTAAFGTTALDLQSTLNTARGNCTSWTAVLIFGAVGGNLDAQPKLQHSNDNSQWDDVTGGVTTASLVAATNANTIRTINVRTGGSLRRYLRLNLDYSASATLSCVLWIGEGSGHGINGADEISRAVQAGLLDRATVAV